MNKPGIGQEIALYECAIISALCYWENNMTIPPELYETVRETINFENTEKIFIFAKDLLNDKRSGNVIDEMRRFEFKDSHQQRKLLNLIVNLQCSILQKLTSSLDLESDKLSITHSYTLHPHAQAVSTISRKLIHKSNSEIKVLSLTIEEKVDYFLNLLSHRRSSLFHTIEVILTLLTFPLNTFQDDDSRIGLLHWILYVQSTPARSEMNKHLWKLHPVLLTDVSDKHPQFSVIYFDHLTDETHQILNGKYTEEISHMEEDSVDANHWSSMKRLQYSWIVFGIFRKDFGRLVLKEFNDKFKDDHGRGHFKTFTRFNIHEEVLWLQDLSANSDRTIEFNFDIPALSPDVVDDKLNDLIDTLELNGQNILDEEIYETLKYFIRYLSHLQPETANKLLDILESSLSKEIRLLEEDDETDHAILEPHKFTLEVFAFLLHWLIDVGEDQYKKQLKEKEKDPTNMMKGRKGKTTKKTANANEWDWNSQKQRILNIFVQFLKLDLEKIIYSQTERDNVIGIISKSVNLLLEDEKNVKDQDLRTAMFEILGLSVVSYDQVQAIKTRLMQNIVEEHLSEPIAEFLKMLATNYENVKLTEAVLTEITKMSFTDESKNGKSISKFLVKIAEYLPKEVLKQMVYLQNHLDSQSYQIRVAMIEILANIILYHLVNDSSPSAGTQLKNFLNIIKERFLDVNQYVRIKVMQVLIKLTQRHGENERTSIPIDSLPEFVELTVSRLQDKSSNVRKVAIKLLAEFIDTSPFTAYPPDDGKLSLTIFKKRHEKFTLDLKTNFPNEIINGAEQEKEQRTEIEYKENAGNNDVAMADTNEKQAEKIDAALDEIDLERQKALVICRQFLIYYSDAIKFVTQISDAIPVISSLLNSSHKNEVVEAMSFFGVAMRYGIESAQIGIRAMVHKVWDKETSATSNDEESSRSTSIRSQLVEVYKMIYFESNLQLYGSPAWTESVVAKLLGLTQTMSLAELTSLEELLALMMEKKMIEKSIIEYLWKIFGKRDHFYFPNCAQLKNLPASKSKEFTFAKRRGALMLLRMFGKSSGDIISSKLEIVVGVGLGELGKSDLFLARESCVALQQLVPNKKDKNGFMQPYKRLEMDNVLFEKLEQLILGSKSGNEWFGMTEQAINAIYVLSEHPDIICGKFIQKLSGQIFGVMSEFDEVTSKVDKINISDEVESKGGLGGLVGGSSDPFSEFTHCGAMELAQLCFLVGHVAIKQLVHLEYVEAEYKRRKALEGVDGSVPSTPSRTPVRTPVPSKSTLPMRTPMGTPRGTPMKNLMKGAKRPNNAPTDELEQVVGTAEDEYAEKLLIVRERELMFGDDSLLTVFGPIVAYICANNRSFDHPMLQIQAVLALCKLMCVSSEFCDSNLQLLFTILEKSDNPIVRCNTLIGLGDMTVFFNSLIDQNISYLYARLSDSDIKVRRNTLMVLTHLILNGQIKAKGQISEMAKCLEDASGDRIRDLVKMFFTELAAKENAAVYNNLPDIISNLGHPETGVEETVFRNIMKFLFNFIKKDKQTENVVEKLCLRFRSAESERQWRDIAYCLSMLSFSNEKSVKKLVEGLPHYKDKLAEEFVFKCFQDIIGKAKKVIKLSNEMKQLLEEYGEKLVELQELCIENQEAAENAVSTINGKGKLKKKKVTVKMEDVNIGEYGEESKNNEDEEDVADVADTLSEMKIGKTKAVPSTPSRPSSISSVKKKSSIPRSSPAPKKVPSSRPKAGKSKLKKAISSDEEMDDLSDEPERVPTKARKNVVIDDDDSEEEVIKPSRTSRRK
ncbi:Condensin complex subunit [Nowakowskiella sp. JEL0407]|nr:Condensin complex subunit [Nowakowskiella sp. JEL0407]